MDDSLEGLPGVYWDKRDRIYKVHPPRPSASPYVKGMPPVPFEPPGKQLPCDHPSTTSVHLTTCDTLAATVCVRCGDTLKVVPIEECDCFDCEPDIW